MRSNIWSVFDQQFDPLTTTNIWACHFLQNSTKLYSPASASIRMDCIMMRLAEPLSTLISLIVGKMPSARNFSPSSALIPRSNTHGQTFNQPTLSEQTHRHSRHIHRETTDDSLKR